ncbi:MULTISPECIES: hypothetical protein [unclassified Pseudomonas]|uniref:hypothetical protein n=1 Tax=unclassified Pseudomonas TaxID=196821 RepID=UPI001F5781BF|nr:MULTISPECIES: hypothetical protein [unclassified Pseudomonas]
MEQIRLNKALLSLSAEFQTGASLVDIQSSVHDFEAVKKLGECGLLNCKVALLDQGQYCITWTSKLPFTSSGHMQITRIKASLDGSFSEVKAPPCRWDNTLKYRQGF